MGVESWPPPLNFRPVRSEVYSARISRKAPPFIRLRTYRGSRARGINYEKKAQAHLRLLFPDQYVESPWIHFRLEGEEEFRWCQPDGLLICPERGIITCVEIKYNHTSDAWWQVRHLYQPVLRKLFPVELWRHQACEVVRWYDGATSFPEGIALAASPDLDTELFKVHIFNR